MPYEILKTIHIVAIIVWLAGTAGMALFLINPQKALAPTLRKFDRSVTSPAMGLTWIFGIWLAIDAGWFGDGWLWAKIAFVTLLSGIHGVAAGKLRRFTTNEEHTANAPSAQQLLVAGFVFVAIVVTLVETKLF